MFFYSLNLFINTPSVLCQIPGYEATSALLWEFLAEDSSWNGNGRIQLRRHEPRKEGSEGKNRREEQKKTTEGNEKTCFGLWKRDDGIWRTWRTNENFLEETKKKNKEEVKTGRDDKRTNEEQQKLNGFGGNVRILGGRKKIGEEKLKNLRGNKNYQIEFLKTGDMRWKIVYVFMKTTYDDAKMNAGCIGLGHTFNGLHEKMSDVPAKFAVMRNLVANYPYEHFKTRHWSLFSLRIGFESAENDTKGMHVVNFHDQSMPFPQILLPKKVSGFGCLAVKYLDSHVVNFLHRFIRHFAFYGINLSLRTFSNRVVEFVMRNFWPLLKDNVHAMDFRFSDNDLRRLRHFSPSILCECTSLSSIIFYEGHLPEFPPDENAKASSGQAMDKWLFLPRPDGFSKMLQYEIFPLEDEQLPSKLDAFKAAFFSASSPANFIVIILPPGDIVPFEKTNKFTEERLTLKLLGLELSKKYLLMRCPTARDENKWTKWEKKADEWEFNCQWNNIFLFVYEDHDIGDSLLDTTPGTNNDQPK